MAWWRRFSDDSEPARDWDSDVPRPTAEGSRDDDLPALSESQAEALYGITAFAFAAHGVDVDTDFDGTFHTPAGRSFGLHNLSLVVVALPFEEWEGAVLRHVEGLIAPEPDVPAQPETWLVRLRYLADLPEQPDFQADSRLPGIVVLPAIDTPEAVRELFGRAQVERHAPLEQFLKRGRANLRELPSPELHTLHPVEGDPTADVHLFVSDDFFGASRFLVLSELLASALHVERPPHGVLVAVPNRHLLAVHLLTGIGVLNGLDAIARLAVGECESRPGPISPHVYYLPPGAGPAQQLTEPDGERTRVVVDGEFARILNELAG